MPPPGPTHRPSLPFLNGHQANMSISSISAESMSSMGMSSMGAGGRGGAYAPSTYAQSTIAASTIMPSMQIQPVHNTDTTVWVEGHCFIWDTKVDEACTVCLDKAEEDGVYVCSGCGTVSHGRCLGFVSVVCPEAFHADRVRAAFVRCQASLFYTYRKQLGRPSKQQKANGQIFAFDMDGFIKSLPHDQQEYARMLRETQGTSFSCPPLLLVSFRQSPRTMLLTCRLTLTRL